MTPRKSQVLPAETIDELAALKDDASRSRYLSRSKQAFRSASVHQLIDESRKRLRINTHAALSLAELGALQPGSVLPLRVSPGDPVFLRAGDRRVARAELVEIEGEVAARVLGLIP